MARKEETSTELLQNSINSAYRLATRLATPKEHINRGGSANNLYLVGDDLVKVAKKQGFTCTCQNLKRYGILTRICTVRRKPRKKRK